MNKNYYWKVYHEEGTEVFYTYEEAYEFYCKKANYGEPVLMSRVNKKTEEDDYYLF